MIAAAKSPNDEEHRWIAFAPGDSALFVVITRTHYDDLTGPRRSSRGMQRIAHTLVVNPGRFADGSAAWLDWGRPAGEQVELLGR